MSQSIDYSALFACKLTGKRMSDPVICSDGHSYERSAIEAYFAAGNTVSPCDNKTKLDTANIYPNATLLRCIENHARK